MRIVSFLMVLMACSCAPGATKRWIPKIAAAGSSCTTSDYATTMTGSGSKAIGQFGVVYRWTIFTAPDTGPICKIRVRAQRNGTAAYNCTAYIFDTASSLPTGSALATSASVALSTLSTSEADLDFTIASPLTVTASHVYVVAIGIDTSDNSNYFIWRVFTAGAAWHNGFSFDGSSWSDDNDVFEPTLTLFK